MQKGTSQQVKRQCLPTAVSEAKHQTFLLQLLVLLKLRIGCMERCIHLRESSTDGIMMDTTPCNIAVTELSACAHAVSSGLLALACFVVALGSSSRANRCANCRMRRCSASRGASIARSARMRHPGATTQLDCCAIAIAALRVRPQYVVCYAKPLATSQQ